MKIRVFIILLLNKLKAILYFLPIKKNRIFFISQRGTQYSCNPKYLFEYIYKNYGKEYEYVWCLNNKQNMPAHFKIKDIFKYKSIKYIYYSITSKYYITNTHVESVFTGRKGQIVINTWHAGGAYKSLKLNAFPSAKKYNDSINLFKIKAKKVNFFITSCKKFKGCVNKDLFIPLECFLDIGLPRNDIFFSNNYVNNKIKSFFNINSDTGIILYAPTFRGLKSYILPFDFSLDINSLLENLKKRFNKDFILLLRNHYYDNTLKSIPEKVINASSYPDMQELLMETDILITDYSSSIWDFSFTYKPCFIYAPDKDFYEKEQGFYTPIEEWPFPFAITNEQLVNNILNYDEAKYKIAVEKHHKGLGSYETGNACGQFCKIVFKKEADII